MQNLESSQRNMTIYLEGLVIWATEDCSSVTREVRRKWHNIFRMLEEKKKKGNPEFYNWLKYFPGWGSRNISRWRKARRLNFQQNCSKIIIPPILYTKDTTLLYWYFSLYVIKYILYTFCFSYWHKRWKCSIFEKERIIFISWK